jgi:uncharacterized protein YjbI with pentapeptide repeats
MFRFMSTFVASVSLLCVAGVSHAYLEAHHQQYASTGTCMSCDLSGVELVNWTKTSGQLQQSNLSRANLSLSNLANSNLTGVILTDAKLMNTNFAGSDLTGANLTFANLMGANLVNTDLSGTRFYGANLQQANLYGSNFTERQGQLAASICHAILPDGKRADC